MPESCSIEDCEKPAFALGLCRRCYTRQRKANAEPCKIDGCHKPGVAAGMCSMHYARWYKHGDPLVRRHRHDGNRVDRTQTKACEECGAPFSPSPGRAWSHEQWARAKFCSPSCANARNARGRPPAPGDLSRRTLGSKHAYQMARQQRRAMPHWATWWEDRRRAEDLADLEASKVYCRSRRRNVRGRPRLRYCQSITDAPEKRRFVAGSCIECGSSFVDYAGRHQGSRYCSPCAHAYQNGLASEAKWQEIDPRKVFERDGWRCQICGQKTRGNWPAPTAPTVDHIVPRASGGDHTYANVQCACWRCNARKGAGAANDQLRLAV